MKRFISFILAAAVLTASLFSVNAFAQSNENFNEFSQKLNSSDGYTVKMEISDGYDTIAVTAYVKGDKMAVDSFIPLSENIYIPARLVIDGNECFIYLLNFPFFHFHFSQEDDIFEAISSDIPDNFSLTSSYEETVNGQVMTVEEYTAEDGTTEKFYFDQNGMIARTIFIDADGYETTTDYEFIFSVDESVFRKPVFSVNIIPILEFIEHLTDGIFSFNF